MVKPLIILFLLGALQGAVGWIMVQSGLTGDEVYVKPTRLALHFIFAMILLCYTFWFALQLLVPKKEICINSTLRRFIWLIIFLFGIQLIFGALMAGYKAATVAATWPDINGSYFPDNMFDLRPGWLNLLENKVTIHFVHRNLAYLILVLILIWSVKAFRFNGTSLFNRTKWVPLLLLTTQVVIGIFSVLTSLQIVPNKWGTFEWMAQLHQLVAMLLLISLIWMVYILRTKATE